MSQATNFTTPPGRLIGGSLYRANTKDSTGKPLVDKQNNPRQEFYFCVAIPKGSETHWSATPWGQHLWTAGLGFQPSAGQNPKFSWKVQDGDSAVPDGKGRVPRDRQGAAGCWLLHFSGGFPPKVYTLIGQSAPIELPEPNAIQTGYFVQVNCSTKANGNMQQPGVYLNHHMVCLVAYGPVITVGPDVSSAGFGGAPLPTGASTAPPAGFQAPAPAPVPAAVAPRPAAPQPLPPPAPEFRQVPPARRMLKEFTYDELKAAGWTDQQMIDGGYMAV